MTVLLYFLTLVALILIISGVYGYLLKNGIDPIKEFQKNKIRRVHKFEEDNCGYNEPAEPEVPEDRGVIISTGYWKEVKGVITPGGDPCWKCPNCGFMHVYGIENIEGPYNNCPKCGISLKYPW